MKDMFKLILGVLASLFRSKAKLEAEILVLRQQINVLRRRAPKRPHLNNTDRLGAIKSQPVLGGLHHQYCRIWFLVHIGDNARLSYSFNFLTTR
jgi:hypothetical protein